MHNNSERVSDVIAETAFAIKEMHIRGAGRIARAGASALCDFADGYDGLTLDGFKRDLDVAVKKILDSRPTAVSLWNGVHYSIKDVSRSSDLKAAMNSVVVNSKEFIKGSSEAIRSIASIGARVVQDGDVIMTHCNSSAVMEVIKEAHRQGKRLKVFATESRPWRQGILTVNELADEGVDVTLIIDSAVRVVMKEVSKVLVGADTITSNGMLVNKIGTSHLALAANEARVPFYVCSETYKFSPMTIRGDRVTIEERGPEEVINAEEIRSSVKVFNPVFDSTPAKYIDAIITEVGIVSPGSVYELMIRRLGDGVSNLRD